MEIAALGLRVDGVNGIDRASSSLDRFTKSSKSADQASGGLTAESRNAGKSLADVAREGDKSSASMSKLAGAAKLAAGAFAGIKITTLISDLTMANSRFEQLGTVMGVVGRNASLSQKQVNAYAKEVEAMGISMTESRQTVIKMTQAQMDLSKASDLARLAQDAAVIANTNSSEALNRLIYGLQSGQVEILRNMGLNVNFAKSYGELADQMGIATDQLTEADKIQARTNATMAAGIGIAGAYDASMENAGKQLGSTTRYLQDLGVMWGEVFSKAGHDAIFGYSDVLKSLHERTKALRDDGTLESISKAIGTLARGLVTAAKVTGAYVVAVYTIPAAKMAASAATAAYTAVLKLFSAQVALTTKTLLSMRTALNVVVAAFAGWEIGTYLRNEFEFVEKAGIALMSGLHTIAVTIAGEFAIMGERVKFALTNPFDFARGVIADFFGWIAGLGKNALKLIGFEDLAAGIDTEFKGIRGAVGSEHAAMLKEMRATTQTEVAGINDIYAEMFADVGKSAGANLKVVGKSLDDVLDRLGGFNDELKETGGNTGGIKKVDTAFQSLYDSLFPAEAAQRKYNEQIALLKKHLSGDRLARAVSKLTKQFMDGDADGAAKAIEEYNKRLNELTDRLNPAAVAARTFKEEQLLLIDAIARTGDPTGELARSLEELERQYSETSRVTNEWTRWTESALDRVDSAFADAWRNIGDGFEGFRKNLTNAFKQMLAELAHMAITRPIVMQIGAAMGIGGGGAMSGIGGMIGSAGGGGLGGIANLAGSAYSALTGWGPAAMAGYQSGGLWGGAQAVGGYYGNMLGNAASTVGGWLGFGGGGAAASGTGFQLGGSLVSGGVGNASYAGAASGAGGAAAYAPWLSGIGGAFMGYQNSGLKGAAAGGLGGWGGAKIGTSLGANFGPVGAAVGAIAGGVLGALGGSKLFGSGEKYKRTYGSTSGYYRDGEYVSTGSITGGRQFGEDYDNLLDAANKAFNETLGVVFDAFDIDSTISTSIATRLRRTSGRLATDISVWIDDELALAVSKQYGGKGNVSEATEQLVSDMLGQHLVSVIQKMDVPEHLKNQLAGLTDAEEVAETITDIFNRFEGVNAILGVTGHAAYELTNAGMILSDQLLDLAGGLENLASASDTYYQNFFTAEEQFEHHFDALTKAMDDAELGAIGSREAYREAVEAIDMTSEAGQEMFAKMMALAGHAAQYFDIIEAQAAQAAQAAAQAAANAVNASMAQANSAYSALERSIAAERKRITAEFNAAAQAQQAAQQAASQAAASRARAQSASLTASLDISKRLIDIFRQIDSAIKSALERLMSTDAAVVAMRREQSLGIVRGALDTARAGGSLADIDGLTDAIAASSVIDSASYKTSVELHREQGRTANLISELGELNGKQLNTEEKIYNRLSAQLEYTRSVSSSVSSGFSGVSASLQAKYDADMAALDDELEAAKLQMDALNGVDNSIMSVREAVDAMNASVVAAIYQQNKFMSGDTSKTDLSSSAATSSNAGLEATIKRMYESTLGYEADAQGVKHWTERIKSGESLSVLQNALTIAAASAAAPKIPAFASGGFHSGGLRIVGEDGPELEATGSSRIFNAAQTEQILSGGRSNDSTSSAITRLENTIAQQAEALRAIAKHTRKTSQQTEMLERWDFDGLPQERTA